ncbi:lambda-exonuclease family protein [Zhongshania marina]|uniref:Endonuclease n=1 Tax=Zhongshania marina TaxID=2304603 RepID=A0A2S4HC21_9GAMM|nr:YqaJ viral recombinase family protein [Marortus luteolus]POP51508.1 endonuclease [Marortus luteolus]
MGAPAKITTSADGNASFYVVDLNQKSDEWLEWRSEGITASDIPIILGLSPYKTPYQLWAEKTGRFNTADISANPNVKRGNRLEDKARQVSENRAGQLLVPSCGEYRDWRPFRASFDGLDENFKPHEFKAPSDAQWEDVKAKGVNSAAYIMYEAQTQAQAIVAGQNEGILLFYRETENGPEDMEFPISVSEGQKISILNHAKWFWNLVETNTPPEKDPERDVFEPAEGDDYFAWRSYADIWRDNHSRMKALKEQLSELDKDQKAVQKQMITMMGPFMQADVGGVKISLFVKQGNIDYKSFLADKFPGQDFELELENYRKDSRSESRFTKSEDALVNIEIPEQLKGRSSYF